MTPLDHFLSSCFLSFFFLFFFLSIHIFYSLSNSRTEFRLNMQNYRYMASKYKSRPKRYTCFVSRKTMRFCIMKLSFALVLLEFQNIHFKTCRFMTVQLNSTKQQKRGIKLPVSQRQIKKGRNKHPPPPKKQTNKQANKQTNKPKQQQQQQTRHEQTKKSQQDSDLLTFG